MQIANRMIFMPNFCRYTYREDMIGDAIENMVLYADNFDPDMPNPNPFGYFSRITFFAFVRRIQKEAKQQKVKEAIFQADDYIMYDEDGNPINDANALANAYDQFFRKDEDDSKFYDPEKTTSKLIRQGKFDKHSKKKIE